MTQKHWRELQDESLNKFAAQKRLESFRPKTEGQILYVNSVFAKTVTICSGPAGTGKTWLACAVASKLLKEKKITKLVITRPLAECDEETGFLPGTLMEKIEDSMRPLLDSLLDFFSSSELVNLMKEEQLIIVPLAKMRGRTFKNAFIILDEAQNATYRQLKMFLTRLGENSKMVINGDYTQSDLPYDGVNSLFKVVERFRPNCNNNVSLIELSRKDIVRHPLIQWIDERLSDEVPRPAPDDYELKDNFNSFNCLECKKLFWYENSSEDEILRCCHCDSFVELYDRHCKYDPMTIEEPGEKYYVGYPYDPYKKRREQEG